MTNWRILRGKVESFSKHYHGPKFHALLCDPPYHLYSPVTGKPAGRPDGTRSDPFQRVKAQGFMGKEWDGGNISFRPETWAGLAEHLYPGAFGMAFAGARTEHRIACAIEDAGLIIHPSIYWIYGCLSEDTEILTRQGWKKGIAVTVGEEVAAWDSKSEQITLIPVEEKTLAPYKGYMIHLFNADTDQLLTPNHRVYRRSRLREQVNGERNSCFHEEWNAIQAGCLSRCDPTKLPLAGYHSGSGIGGDDYAALLAWVWTEGGFDSPNNYTGVRIYQSSVNQDNVDEITNLLYRLTIPFKLYTRQRQYKDRSYIEYCWYMSGQAAAKIRQMLPQKHPTWELLYMMTQSEKQAFYVAAMKGDGGIAAFYQKSRVNRDWFQALLHLIGKQGKHNDSKIAVSVNPDSVTELQHRHMKDAAVLYNGMVWCVRVATGAFVARRNGKVFITGNSGFPKATRIDTQIDKKGGQSIGWFGLWLREYRKQHGINQSDLSRHFPSKTGGLTGCVCNWELGHNLPTVEQFNKLVALLDLPFKTLESAEREIVGRCYDSGNRRITILADEEKEYNITQPTTLLAKQWVGHRYGLQAIKPAAEPIIVFQKPYAGKSVDSITKYGAGALWIDGGRIGLPDGHGGGSKGSSGFVDGYKHDGFVPSAVGRWPANFILCHDADCQYINKAWQCVEGCPVKVMGEQSGESGNGKERFAVRPRNKGWANSSPGDGVLAQDNYADADTASRFFFNADWLYEVQEQIDGAAPFFYCAKASRTERNLGLSDFEQQVTSDGRQKSINNPYQRGETLRHNNHPCVKPIKLTQHLATLLLPPQAYAPRRLLVPFAGSGSETIGGLLSGWDEIIAVEREREYVSINKARLRYWQGKQQEEDMKPKQLSMVI